MRTEPEAYAIGRSEVFPAIVRQSRGPCCWVTTHIYGRSTPATRGPRGVRNGLFTPTVPGRRPGLPAQAASLGGITPWSGGFRAQPQPAWAGSHPPSETRDDDMVQVADAPRSKPLILTQVRNSTNRARGGVGVFPAARIRRVLQLSLSRNSLRHFSTQSTSSASVAMFLFP
jgi:hypothetical protein